MATAKKKKSVKHTKRKVVSRPKTTKKVVTKSKNSKKKVTKKTVNVKQRKKVQPKEEQVFYMGIPNPIEVRRNILESARDMVHFLQMFEKFRLIREEKKEASKLLKKHVKELNTLVNKLKILLPKTSIRTRSKEETIEKIEEPKKIKVVQEPEKSEIPDLSIDDIEALESELKEIEGKLNFL